MVIPTATLRGILDRSMSEERFQSEIRKLATLRGWLCWHAYDSRRSPEGFPDLTLVRPPRLVFAELKSEHGRLTPSQELWLETLGAVPGVEVYCWKPHDWARLEEVLF